MPSYAQWFMAYSQVARVVKRSKVRVVLAMPSRTLSSYEARQRSISPWWGDHQQMLQLFSPLEWSHLTKGCYTFSPPPHLLGQHKKQKETSRLYLYFPNVRQKGSPQHFSSFSLTKPMNPQRNIKAAFGLWISVVTRKGMGEKVFIRTLRALFSWKSCKTDSLFAESKALVAV